MTRRFIFPLLVIMALIITACGGTGAPAAPTTGATTAAEAPTTATDFVSRRICCSAWTAIFDPLSK